MNNPVTVFSNLVTNLVSMKAEVRHEEINRSDYKSAQKTPRSKSCPKCECIYQNIYIHVANRLLNGKIARSTFNTSSWYPIFWKCLTLKVLSDFVSFFFQLFLPQSSTVGTTKSNNEFWWKPPKQHLHDCTASLIKCSIKILRDTSSMKQAGTGESKSRKPIHTFFLHLERLLLPNIDLILLQKIPGRPSHTQHRPLRTYQLWHSSKRQ